MPHYPVERATYWDGAHYYPVEFLGDPTPPTQAPTAVTGLDAAVTSTTVTLSWVASVPGAGDGIDHYVVQRQTSPGVWTTVGTPGGSPFTVTGLSPQVSYTFRVQAISDQGLASPWVQIQTQTSAPAAMVVVFSSPSDQPNRVPSPDWRALDARMAARVGVGTPLVAGRHSYSNNAFPATFAASTAKQAADYGCKFAVLNVKCGWDSLANGGQDSRITGFLSSIPAGFTVYLLINHEPENDLDTVDNYSNWAAWCAGQARAANIIAAANDPRLHFGVCHMGYTFQPGATYPEVPKAGLPKAPRIPNNWNPWPQMTAAAKARTILAPDGYTDMKNSAGTSYQTMAQIFDPIWAAGASWGAQRIAISEHALNNDVGASGAACANWWNTVGFPYIRNKNLVYYAAYNSHGPAAGENAYIDTAEEETAFGAFCLEFRP